MSKEIKWSHLPAILFRLNGNTMNTVFRRNTLYFFVFIGSLALSSFVSWQTQKWQEQRNIETFSHTVRESFLFIEKSFEEHDEILKSIGSYFMASQSVDDEEFRIFTDPHMKSEKGYVSFGWISSTAGQQKIEHFRNLAPFQAPSNGIPEANSPISNLMREAMETEKIVYFTGNRLFGADLTGYNATYILSLYPVYKKHAKTNVQQPAGFSFSILDLQGFIQNIIGNESNPYISLGIMATIENGKRRLLYQSALDPAAKKPYRRMEELKIGDQSLYLTFYPTERFIAMHKSSRSYILFVGLYLMLSTLALLYLRQLRSHMDELMESQRKAEEASRLKDDFLATMSHEIRSPMSGVLGMAELMLNTQLSLEQKSYTRTILSSGEILLNIIEDILDVSKIEANKLVIDPIEVNMVDLVHDVSSLYSYKAQEKALELAVRYAPGCQQHVIADPVRVRQILGNLINNAIKFTDKGHVAITVREDFDAEVTEGSVQLVFSIEDTGIGIRQEALERIFEKFSQADSSTTRQFGGTGLGLSICKRLTDLMQGTITVESKVGSGSIFTFSLPLQRSAEHQTQHLKPLILQNMRILIVDDLPVLRTLIREQLNLSGMRCDAAESGEEALAMMKAAAARGEPYSMAILDYLMPDINGETLAGYIKEDEELQKCCLILMTTAGNPILSKNCSEKGFSACLTKPVNINNLIEMLSAVWQKYQSGNIRSIIQVDTQPLNPNEDIEDFTLSRAKVLVAEDSRLNQAFVEDVLEQLDCEVKIVVNGLEALKALQHSEYDLILMDCQMPVMDGFEATRQICALKAQGMLNPDLPIIALTANAMEGDRRKCLDAGMNDYLSKPVRVRDLKRKIFHWLRAHARKDGKKASPPNIVTTDFMPLRSNKYGTAKDTLIDYDALDKSRQVFGKKYHAMVDIFIEDTQSFINEASKALEEKDFSEAIRPFHTIKSTSLRMGAAQLASVSKEAESLLRDAEEASFSNLDEVSLREKLLKTTEMFEKTKAFLETSIAQQSAGSP